MKPIVLLLYDHTSHTCNFQNKLTLLIIPSFKYSTFHKSMKDQKIFFDWMSVITSPINTFLIKNTHDRHSDVTPLNDQLFFIYGNYEKC